MNFNDYNIDKIKYKDGEEEIIKRNNLINEHLKTIGKILEMHPELKTFKVYDVDQVFDKEESKSKSNVFDKVTLGKISFYVSGNGNIYDSNTNLIGFWTETKTKTNYYLFDTFNKITETIVSNKQILF
jgi:hypothetical protein